MSSPNVPIVNFVFGLKKTIPKNKVGDFLEWVFHEGFEPSEVVPVFDAVRPATEEEAKSALRLPDLRAKKGLKEIVLSAMREHGKPMRPRDLVPYLAKFNKTASNYRNVLYVLLQEKIVKRSNRLYSLRNHEEKPKTKRRGNGPTQHEVVLKMLASGERRSTEVAAELAKYGWSHASSGTVLFAMMQKGLVKRVAPATYAKA